MDDYVKIPSPGFRSKKKPAPAGPLPQKKPIAQSPVAKSAAQAPTTKKFGVSTLSDYAEAMKRSNKDLEAFERANRPAASNNMKAKK